MHSYSPQVEVTHVSPIGFWLLLGAEAFQLRFDDFPLLRDASPDDLTEVQWPQPDRLYWPKLGVELPMSMIRPELDPRLMVMEPPPQP